MIVQSVRDNQNLLQVPADVSEKQELRRLLILIVNRLNSIGYYEAEDTSSIVQGTSLRPPSIVATSRLDLNLLRNLDERLKALETP